MLNSKQFEHYLSSLDQPFTSLNEVLVNGGNALTIDDSTRAAAAAALLARKCGHDVTLFVNISNIISNDIYPLHMLNIILDEIQHPFEFDGLLLNDVSYAEKKVFRREFKERLFNLNDNIDQYSYISLFAKYLNLSLSNIPNHLLSINIDELKYLVSNGVSIQNHGWDHVNYERLSKEDLIERIQEARSWLKEHIQVDAKYFAVPFGDYFSPRINRPDLFNCWFLLTSKEKEGYIGSGIYNRSKLKLNEW